MSKQTESYLPTPEDFTFATDRQSSFDQVPTEKPVGFFGDALQRFMTNKASVLAFFIIMFIVLMAIFGPGMTPYGYNDQNIDLINLPPRIPVLAGLGVCDGSRMLYNRRYDNLSDPEKYPAGGVLEVSNVHEVNGVKTCDVKVDAYALVGLDHSTNYWFGTDYLGRDLWTRTWRGMRVSLTIALLAVFISMIIGTVYGAIAGYYGGKADMLMMRLAEILSSFPQSIVATLLILLIGTGISAIVIALVITGWVGSAMLIRAQFLRFKQREYVLAARSLGVGDGKLIFRHILPNSIGPLITKAMIDAPAAIFSEAFLAFIGLGIQAPEPSIGVLLSDAQKVLVSYPYQTFFPAILISILMISFNLFGNGLRDAFDPTMRGTE